MQLVDYIIASGETREELEVMVRRHIQAGYEPSSGFDHDFDVYLQPMVKYGTFAPLKERTQSAKPIRSTDEPMGYNS